MKKITVGILYGGKSAEHEISLLSAKNIIEAIDKEKFNPIPIKIEKNGDWEIGLVRQPCWFSLKSRNFSASSLQNCCFIRKLFGKLKFPNKSIPVDVVFPILHGPFGEDGTVQGLLKIANIPFVGSGVLGSAVGMDKDVMKRLLRDAGLPIGKFLVKKIHEPPLSFSDVETALGCPVFIKPANMVSSVGISRVRNEAEYEAALKEAFKYDKKIVIEEFIEGREIECAVLGNENPIASIPGEIIPAHDFYSYDAKYIDNKGAALEIPAKLDDKIIKQVQELSIKVFQTLCCEGLSRVDFFLKEDGDKNFALIINEINTMPGFTAISMYPKLWEASIIPGEKTTGISYTDLITRLIELAL